MATSDPKTGPGLALSLAIIVLGFVLAVTGSVLVARHLTETQTSSVNQAPGSIEQDLDPGQYDIFGESLDFLQLLEDDGLLPDEFSDASITVRDPSGQELPVGPPDPDLGTNRGFTFYTHVGSFEVVEDGTYTVDVQNTGSTTFVVGESVVTAWRDAILWMIVGVVGTLMLLAGVVMLILGIVRRQREAKNQPAQTTTPGQFPTQPQPPMPQPPMPQPNISPPPPPAGQNPSSF